MSLLWLAMRTHLLRSASLIALCFAAAPARAQPYSGQPLAQHEEGPLRIDGLAARAPDRILVFVVRRGGIEIPVVSFLDVVRRTIDAHMHARVVSMEEAFVRAGDSLQRRLDECKGDDGCYARLAGSVDAHVRIFDARSGAVLWDEDTNRAYPTVNGVPGHGGSMSGGAAPLAVDGTLIFNSGYAFLGKLPGNVLLVYEVE